MRLYRLLTGADDAAFCKRVSQALNKGWSLHGSPSVSYDPNNLRPICAQAIVKDVPGDGRTICWMMISSFRSSDLLLHCAAPLLPFVGLTVLPIAIYEQSSGSQSAKG